MDWAGWAIFGVIGTSLLTGVLIMAQLAGWTRLDLPMMLGTVFVAASSTKPYTSSWRCRPTTLPNRTGRLSP